MNVQIVMLGLKSKVKQIGSHSYFNRKHPHSFLCVTMLLIYLSNLNLVYNGNCTKVTNCHSDKWCFNLNTFLYSYSDISVQINCLYILQWTIMTKVKSKWWIHTSYHTAACDWDKLSGETWPACDYLEMTSWFITQFSKF